MKAQELLGVAFFTGFVLLLIVLFSIALYLYLKTRKIRRLAHAMVPKLKKTSREMKGGDSNGIREEEIKSRERSDHTTSDNDTRKLPVDGGREDIQNIRDAVVVGDEPITERADRKRKRFVFRRKG